MNKSFGSKIFDIFNLTLLIILALVCLLPFINIIAISFSDSVSTASGQVKLWPVGFNIASYKYAIAKPEFIRAFIISIVRVVIALAISLVLNIMAAYPLSKDSREFRARTFYVWYFFITMLFSGGMIPFYIVIKKLNLIGNIFGIILPFVVMTYTLILMVGFFRSLPKELNDAALVDGAGHMRTLWNIMVPVSLPGIATITLVIGVFYWNEWFYGLILTNSNKGYPLQSYLQTVVIAKTFEMFTGSDPDKLAEISKLSDRTLKSAQILIATVPILAFYPFLQKYFVKGLVVGSVKG